MTKYYLIIALLFVSADISAKKIYKCKKENGTLSYQEEPCVADNRTIKETIEQNKNSQNLNTQAEIDDFVSDNIDIFSIDLKTYNISVLKAKYWRVFKKVLADDMLHLKMIDDEKGSEFSLLIDFIKPKDSITFTQKDLDEQILQIGERMLLSSGQDKVNPIKLDVNNGFGVMANFTDQNLLGKSSYPPGEYLDTTVGLIYKDDFYIHFTLLYNKIESLNYILAISSLLNGIEIHKLDKQNQIKTATDPLDKPYHNFQNGNKRESVAMFEAVIADMPNNFKAWIGYCMALRDTKRLQSAFIACDKALDLSPNNIEVYATLINLYSMAFIWQEGIDFIENKVPNSDNKNLINAITNFGFHAMSDKSFEVAQSAFDNAKQRGSQEPRLIIDMAMLKYTNGEKQSAIDDIESVLKTNTSNTFAEKVLVAMKANMTVIIPDFVEESTVSIPSRLKVLGQHKNHNQQPDNWVNKTFRLKGVGHITLEVPESWYEHFQITETDNLNNEISIKLLDLNTLSTVSIDLGKVNDNWNSASLKEIFTANLAVFFGEESIQLMPLNNSKIGYKYYGISTKDSIEIEINSQHELRGILSIKSVAVGTQENSNMKEITDRIIRSIEVLNYNDTPLVQIDKIEESKPQKTSIKPANDTELPPAPNGFS